MTDSPAVLAWWATMSTVGVVNLGLWAGLAQWWHTTPLPAEERAYRWRQLALAGVYTLGCASRSWVLRADVQRFAMIDHVFGSVAVGRSVATVAELVFVAQWALLLDRLAKQARSPGARWIARALVPIIAVAEVCSWTAVITTNYLGNACEESLWTLTGALFLIGLARVRSGVDASAQRFATIAVVACAAYVAFMTTVDVPMYLTRWRADEAAGKVYFGLAEGFADATRVVVTRRWEDWRDEVPWMSLYFSVAVWMSLAMVRWPTAREGDRAPAT